MTDSDIINEAYADTVKNLFSVFFDSSVIAKTPADQTQAEQQFQAGVRKAREVRDKAMALVS
jgi:hypothetical protein